MYLLHKYPHPLNFAFADRRRGETLGAGGMAFHLSVTSSADDIHHVEITRPALWPEDYRTEPLTPVRQGSWTDGAAKPETRLEIPEGAGFRLKDRRNGTLLEAEAGAWFGVSGAAWLFQFRREPEMAFYGLGEKHTPFERSNRAYRFRNVDVWADHPLEPVAHGDYDPDYISIPYLIVKRGNTYLGLLSDNPYPGTAAISPEGRVASQLKIRLDYPPTITMGAENGVPSLYILHGPSLAELTRKFQQLVGTTPLPPLWALGYHQSRWGYGGAADLEELADRFETHRFPCDGLWLDIDYMDGFRVFTFDPDQLPRPEETISNLKDRGFRVVPILDPGVKREPGYPVYESGLTEGCFCRNPAGTPFVGMVWPGFTVFPDFSLETSRNWWAAHARRFFETGFDGAWIDMNDPSTGPVDPTAMRFREGRVDHDALHNQYALLMARATRQGFADARPDQRPFLLSRSGSTGSGKYAAHWTGDNFSNYHHLRRSIGKSIHLALSGIPFNGPDVGGFGGDCPEALFVDWIKAAFLFPFFRNHTMRGSRSQEPWAYSPEALAVVRHFVRLRYRLLPYLYNLFMDQEETGEAILRPLFYDFPDTPELPLGRVDDQFMVGPAMLQAPFVREGSKTRELVLPEGKWLDAETGRWTAGNQRVTAEKKRWSTPLYLRDGALLPFQPEEPTDNRTDLNRIGLLCCLSPETTGTAHYRYRADDGISFAYRKGERSAVDLSARVEGENLIMTVDRTAVGYGPIQIIPFTEDRFQKLVVEEGGRRWELEPMAETVRLAGDVFSWYRWVPTGSEG